MHTKTINHIISYPITLKRIEPKKLLLTQILAQTKDLSVEYKRSDQRSYQNNLVDRNR